MLSRSPASTRLRHGAVTLGQTMKVIKGLLGDQEVLCKLARLGGAPEDEGHPTILAAYVNRLALGILSEEMQIEQSGPSETYPPYLLNALAAQGLNNPEGRLQARVLATAHDQSLAEQVLGQEQAFQQVYTDYHEALLSGNPVALAEAKATLAQMPASLLASETAKSIEAKYRPRLKQTYHDTLTAMDRSEDLVQLRQHSARINLLRSEVSPALIAKWDSPPQPHPIMALLPEEDRIASMQRPQAGYSVKARYQEKARSLLQHIDDPILRNQEITAF